MSKIPDSRRIKFNWSPPQSTYYIINYLLYNCTIHKHTNILTINYFLCQKSQKGGSTLFCCNLWFIYYIQRHLMPESEVMQPCVKKMKKINNYPPKMEQRQLVKIHSSLNAQHCSVAGLNIHVVCHVTYSALPVVFQLLVIWRLEGNLSSIAGKPSKIGTADNLNLNLGPSFSLILCAKWATTCSDFTATLVKDKYAD